MDPIHAIKFVKDSTLAMLAEAQKRQYQIYYMEQKDLFSQQGKTLASLRPLRVFDNPSKWFELGSTEVFALDQLDVILMRKDPPFDMNFIYTTYLLDEAERNGCLVVNRPQSLRDCNEKFFATEFPQCCPPLLVDQNHGRLKDFINQHLDIVVKPLDGMGGQAIFRIKKDDANTNVILETLTRYGQTPIMAQKFIPQISAGDKRILLINGEPIPHGLARIPAKGELRGNLAAGGTGKVVPLTERDYWICEQVGPSLVAKGLIFVGIDVIGDYLTEINVTSPTCIREIDKDSGSNISAALLDCIELQLT